MMAEKYRNEAPLNGQVVMAPTTPTAQPSFFGCRFHRQNRLINSSPMENGTMNIQDQRRTNKCPTVEDFRTVKNAIIKEWMDLGLHGCVEYRNEVPLNGKVVMAPTTPTAQPSFFDADFTDRTD